MIKTSKRIGKSITDGLFNHTHFMIKNATKKILKKKNTKSRVVKEKVSVGVEGNAGDKKPVKRYKVKPNLRQRKVIEILIEKPWISKAEALRQAGYSDNTLINPHLVFEARAIQDFFANDGSGLPALKKKHNELLNSAEIRRLNMPARLDNEEIEAFFHTEIPWSKVLRILRDDDNKYDCTVVLRAPDSKLQLAALDMAWKILGVYKDPSAWNPPPINSPDEQSIRVSKAKQIFQLWTQQSPNNPSSPPISSK